MEHVLDFVYCQEALGFSVTFIKGTLNIVLDLQVLLIQTVTLLRCLSMAGLKPLPSLILLQGSPHVLCFLHVLVRVTKVR